MWNHLICDSENESNGNYTRFNYKLKKNREEKITVTTKMTKIISTMLLLFKTALRIQTVMLILHLSRQLIHNLHFG